MRKRRKKHGFLLLAAVFLLSAAGIRLLSASGAERYIKEKLVRLSSDEDFVRYAMSGETPLIRSDGEKKILRAFASQLPYTGDVEETALEPEIEQAEAEEEKKKVDLS